MKRDAIESFRDGYCVATFKVNLQGLQQLLDTYDMYIEVPTVSELPS